VPIELTLPPDLAVWREEVRAFLASEMDPARTAGHIDPSDLTGLDRSFERAHQRAAAKRGYLAISVPTEYGGGGQPQSWKSVYDMEAASVGAPSIDTGITLCGSPLIQQGTTAQQQRWLAPMVAGDMMGAIAYSESGAGNDLAALTTVSSRSDDGWILSGRKALVTGAHKAEVAIVLALTDPEGSPRRSMSMFLVPLELEGVTIERQPTLNRWTLSEISFDEVSLDAEALLGDVGRGWAQVMSAMASERGSLAHLGWATRRVEDLPPATAPSDRARLHVELSRVRRFGQRILDLQEDGAVIGYEASIMKITATELLQDIARVALAAATPAEAVWNPLFADGSQYGYDAIEWIHPTISVGANETHRDMIAAQLLGEPGLGTDRPDHAGQCGATAELARDILELTVAQTKTTPLYGQTVADFQVARHRLVEMLIAVESMDLAAGAGDQDPTAQVICRDGLLDVMANAHQLCGGAGYLAGHPLAEHTRRALELQAQLT
jgi:alkylation response protein AidB-like acyl-CoA dehydrogenase